jgi:hypothetical protein
VIERERLRPFAVRTLFAVTALAAGGAVASWVHAPPASGVRVALDEVGDRAVVQIDGTDGRVVEIAIDTRIGEGRLVVGGAQERGSVEIELVDLPGRAYLDGVEHRLVAGGPAVRLRSTKGRHESMRLCLPYDRSRGDGGAARFLRVDGAASSKPVVNDATAASDPVACGDADATAVFGAGWVFALDDSSVAAPAVRNPTATGPVPTTTRPGGLAGSLGATDVALPGTTSTTTPDAAQPPIAVELGSDLPASGVLLDLSGMGPGARVQRCVTVEVRSSPQPSMTVRPMIEVPPGDSGPLLDNVRLSLEEGTAGAAGCASFSPARPLLSAEAVREAGRRHATWATGLPGWTVAEWTRRTYRVTVELPGATPNLPASPARFTLRWELR